MDLVPLIVIVTRICSILEGMNLSIKYLHYQEQFNVPMNFQKRLDKNGQLQRIGVSKYKRYIC